MGALLIIGYLALAAAIVYFSILLSNYVDNLDKKTNLSGALLGGILLAMVTSLPELFTSLTAVIGVGETSYVMGNILGSDLFDIIVLTALFIVFIKNTCREKLSKNNIVQLCYLLGCYALIAVSAFLPANIKQYIVLGGWFNLTAIPVALLFILSVIFTPKTKDEEEDNDEEKADEIKLTVKQIVIRFVICSIVLIGCSIGITYLSDMIVDRFNIDTTLAGALLLGVMTSLPELISTANLFYKKNLDAGTGNIIGSCVFNMIIISLAELFSFNGSVFSTSPESNKLIILGIAGIVCCLITILIKIFWKVEKEEKKATYVKGGFMVFFSLLSVASYVLYLVLPSSLFAF